MAFNSYSEWSKYLHTLGLSDIIFGVKPTITKNTLYIGVNDLVRIGSDNDFMIIGYVYDVILSVPTVDSPFIESVSQSLTDGLSYQNWDEKNHMYVYSGLVKIPIGEGGEPWQKV